MIKIVQIIPHLSSPDICPFRIVLSGNIPVLNLHLKQRVIHVITRIDIPLINSNTAIPLSVRY